MKYFTKAQIEEIRKQLATLGVRDTDLPNASALSGDELVAIVQGGINKKVGVRKLIHDYLPDDIADGEDGKSAYDIWLEQGNEGTPLQFLQSLKGDKGDKGDTGAQGPAGAAGATGPAGASGTPGTSAGFGTPTASVTTDESGEVGVTVNASGPNTAKIFEFVFKNLASGGGTTPSVPSESAQMMFSAAATNPGTPATTPANWHATRTGADVWMALRFWTGSAWGEWTIINIGDVVLPYASFKSFVFKRAASQPDRPSGGNYSSPVPSPANGWSDGIPSGNDAVWMSSRTFASDNTHSDANWSTPELVADSQFMDYEFSSAENPSAPVKTSPTSANTNPQWSNTADENTIWMAMREVSNGAYKSGSTWMLVKVKGEDGKDGTSVNIKGSVSNVGDLPATDNEIGDGYILSTNGHLYVWDGDSWEDCGQIKGDPGANGSNAILHIKYSNDPRVLTTPASADFSGNDGEDPGDYIGVYWDYTVSDSSDPADYTWKYWKGQDGFGYEYIFKLTATATAPNLPASSPNTDDYVPTSEGWTDDPGGVSAEYPFCWVAWRKKENGVWSAWYGTTNNKARLYSHYGINGLDGTDGVDGKDALPIRIRNWSEIGGVTLTGNDRVFSGFEEDAPFRDVIVVTSGYYPSRVPYPFNISNPIGTGTVETPVLLLVNYSSSYASGYSGTNLSLPTSASYTNTIASTRNESELLYNQGRVYSVFQNLGAVYAQILVATSAYIGGLTVDHMTTNAGNNSYIVIDDGLIKFYDDQGRVRIIMGQESGDSSPVLKFYDSDGSSSQLGTLLYDLGPGGLMKDNGPINVPEWTKLKVIASSGNRFAGNETIDPTTATSAYRYDAGYRYSETAANSGVYVKLYLDPYTMSTFSVTKPDMDGDYLDTYYSKPTAANYASSKLPVGEYIIMPIEPDRTYGYSASVVRIASGQGGVRTVNTNLIATFTESGGVYTMSGPTFDPNDVPTL